MKKIDTNLKQVKETVAPSGREVNRKAALPGFTGTLPLPTSGIPIASTDIHLTEGEKKTLKAIGWNEGDPIPSNLANNLSDAIAQAKAEMETDYQQTMAANLNRPVFKPPKEIAFEDLPPERQKEIADRINNARLLTPQQDDSNYIEIVDSRTGKPKKVVDAATLPTIADIRRISGISGAPVQEAMPSPEPEVVSEVKITQCKHCGFPVDQEDVIVNDRDKYNFLQAVLGGTRFYKEFALFDGNLKITYRTLTTPETDLVFRQMALEMKDNTIESSADYWLKLMTYRLALAVERIETPSGGPILIPELKEFKVDFDPVLKTPIPKITEHVMSEIAPQETIRRILVNQLAHFQRTVEHLEARMNDSDFWKVIEAQN